MNPKSRIAKKYISTIDVTEKTVVLRPRTSPIIAVVKKVG